MNNKEFTHTIAMACQEIQKAESSDVIIKAVAKKYGIKASYLKLVLSGRYKISKI